MFLTGDLDVLLSSFTQSVNEKLCDFNQGTFSYELYMITNLLVNAQEKFHGKGAESKVYSYYKRLGSFIKFDANSLYNSYINLIRLCNNVYGNIQDHIALTEEGSNYVALPFEVYHSVNSAIDSLEIRTFDKFYLDCTNEPSALSIWDAILKTNENLLNVSESLKNDILRCLQDTEWSIKDEIVGVFNKINEKIGGIVQVVGEISLSTGQIAMEAAEESEAYLNDLNTFGEALRSKYPPEALEQIKANYYNATGEMLGGGVSIASDSSGVANTPAPENSTMVLPTETTNPETTEVDSNEENLKVGSGMDGKLYDIARPGFSPNTSEALRQAITQPAPIEGLIGGESLLVSGKSTDAFKQQAGTITGGHQGYTVVPDSEYTNQPGTISQSEYQIVIAQVAGEGANNPSDMFGVCCTMFNRRETDPGSGTNFTKVLAEGYWPWGKTYLAYMPGGKYYNTDWGQDKLAVAKQVVDQALQGYRNLPADGLYYYGDGKNNHFRNVL